MLLEKLGCGSRSWKVELLQSVLVHLLHHLPHRRSLPHRERRVSSLVFLVFSSSRTSSLPLPFKGSPADPWAEGFFVCPPSSSPELF